MTDATSASILSLDSASGTAHIVPPVLTPFTGDLVRGEDSGDFSGRGDMFAAEQAHYIRKALVH